MAWTDPSTWVAGAILTAAQLNSQLRDNMLAGGPIYTTAAAREAAITAPFEGQRAYLTAPAAATVTATGANTAIPTGIQTIYNGSAWVCVTPVAAFSEINSNYTSTSYGAAAATGDTAAISVTLPTGTTAFVSITGQAYHSSAGGTILVSPSVATGGSTYINASDTYAAAATGPVANYLIPFVRTWVMTGLTAGVNTFTLNYKTSGATLTLAKRNLVVSGVA